MYYVVVTQSCDLLHDELDAEPWCEVIRLRRSSELKGVFEHGRNARRLHCSVLEKGESFPVELLAHDRYFVPRDRLSELAPLSGIKLDRVDVLADWLGRRYTRPALPGRFNDRIQTQEKALRSLLKKQHSLFRDFYLRLSSFEELPDDQPYAVKLLLVAEAETFDGQHSPILEFATRFSGILAACRPKLDVRELLPMSDATVTLQLIDGYVPWDIFDYLTTRDSEPAGATVSAVENGPP